MSIWQDALAGSNAGKFPEKAGETVNTWCRCVFCASADTSFKARLGAVNKGWRYFKGKWICPKCMGIIRPCIQKEVY